MFDYQIDTSGAAVNWRREKHSLKKETKALHSQFSKSIFEKIVEFENWHQIISFDTIYYQIDMLHDPFRGKNVDFWIFTPNQFFEK